MVSFLSLGEGIVFSLELWNLSREATTLRSQLFSLEPLKGAPKGKRKTKIKKSLRFACGASTFSVLPFGTNQRVLRSENCFFLCFNPISEGD